MVEGDGNLSFSSEDEAGRPWVPQGLLSPAASSVRVRGKPALARAPSAHTRYQKGHILAVVCDKDGAGEGAFCFVGGSLQECEAPLLGSGAAVALAPSPMARLPGWGELVGRTLPTEQTEHGQQQNLAPRSLRQGRRCHSAPTSRACPQGLVPGWWGCGVDPDLRLNLSSCSPLSDSAVGRVCWGPGPGEGGVSPSLRAVPGSGIWWFQGTFVAGVHGTYKVPASEEDSTKPGEQL